MSRKTEKDSENKSPIIRPLQIAIDQIEELLTPVQFAFLPELSTATIIEIRRYAGNNEGLLIEVSLADNSKYLIALLGGDAFCLKYTAGITEILQTNEQGGTELSQGREDVSDYLARWSAQLGEEISLERFSDLVKLVR